ncbi:Ssy1p SKDI_04G3810 [Saccharomyces kudriavzevii IFO 1802]|uniref:Amino acid permease/ SLC12A domain-containing protein n=1 Tax=Saccharomyces kudriavzevii (strain ATCC MYA-4449 / AS 2.2408 / CBS 8840 / NBRC 1802 / NCYC 2889) TaxID=226230 RepID=A0AA35NR00_SACK1|nr:uncharacterized protein SKDI_04G3810 [Saccharomyces kudriavzevii IFO 1802]CAI4058335.1 hypothetical protein SKDI_04G3810 [Saccharomyces kudriavzevii IFO 1802]
MGSTNQAHDLFPNHNNIQFTDCHSKEQDASSIIGKNDADQALSISGSIDTGILKSIIEEQGWNDAGLYRSSIQNQRFFLMDKYTKKKHITMQDMICSEEERIYQEPIQDFETYNRRVQREYELRERMEEFFRQNTKNGLHILNEDSLNQQYSPLGPTNYTQPLDGYSRMKHMTSRFFKKNLNFSGGFKRRRGNLNTVDYLKTNGSISSSSTDIIDNASYRNIAIDENVDMAHKEHAIDELNEQEIPGDVSPAEGGSLLHDIEKVFNRSRATRKYHIQRKLKVRHIQMLSIGACFSVGLFLTSGKAFSIAGPFGTLLGFGLTGSIILATMLSFTELSTLIPVSSGFSGLASRFVEDAFGFALGWTYWISCMLALPAQVSSSTFYLSYYNNVNISKGVTAGFITLFSAFSIVVNLLDVSIMGEIVYVAGISKVIIAILMVFAMVILNAGHGNDIHEGVGFRYWDSSKSVRNLTYGLYRPTFDLADAGEGSRKGISGSKGRFLATASVMLISTFAFSGVEMTFLASGEAINPRKTIPSATKRTFSIVLIIYVFLIFSVGINIYSGDPRLLSYFPGISEKRYEAIVKGTGMDWRLRTNCRGGIDYRQVSVGTGYSSPWVVALQNFGLCTFASAFNAILIFFTATAGISSLFSCSRTLYAMSVQRKAPPIFEICSKRGVPYVSVIFSSLFSVIAYIAVNQTAIENFDVLANISSASTSIIWMGLNLSFLRFYYALKQRKDIISRNDSSYPYKSPFQPYLAIYGLVGCSLFVIFMGYPNFIHHFWSTKAFFSAYGGLMFFFTSYTTYKILGTSKIQRLDQLDMDSGRREMDRTDWTEHSQYLGTYSERAKKLVTWLI